MKLEELSREQKITLNFIMLSAKSSIDLRWKMGKYINNNDLSFLGTTINDLNRQIEDARKQDKPKATITK